MKRLVSNIPEADSTLRMHHSRMEVYRATYMWSCPLFVVHSLSCGSELEWVSWVEIATWWTRISKCFLACTICHFQLFSREKVEAAVFVLQTIRKRVGHNSLCLIGLQLQGARLGQKRLGNQKQSPDRQLFLVSTFWEVEPGGYLQGGKTWAASPARRTLSTENLLHLLAEKAKGLDRRTLIQSDGKGILESEILIIVKPALSILDVVRLNLPILGSRVGEVWHENFHCFRIARHEHCVLSFLHNKFEPPQSVRSRSESTTNRWSFTVADEPEIFWKEDIVDLIRRVF